MNNKMEVPTIVDPLPNDWMSVFEKMKLQTPSRRAAAAAVFAAGVTFILKPSLFFDEEGSMRKQKIPYLHKTLPGMEEDENLTSCHFLIVPVVVGALAGVFL